MALILLNRKRDAFCPLRYEDVKESIIFNNPFDWLLAGSFWANR